MALAIEDKKYIEATGDIEKACIMVLYASPCKDDLEYGAFGYDGFAAREVFSALEEANIPIDKTYHTGMVKVGLGSKKISATDIEAFTEELDAEIASMKPRVIITLGAEVFKRVMKANIKMGDYIGELVDTPYGKVIPTYSPSFVVIQDPTKRPEFKDAFNFAARFLDGDMVFDKYTYTIVNDPAENTRILQSYIDRDMMKIGYDAEWNSTNGKWTDTETMYEFQYCCEPHVAVVLNISKDGTTENRELLDTMKLMLEHPKAQRLGWNIRADDLRLRHRGFNIPDETLAFDGMKAVAFFDSRLPKGLETGIKRFTNYEHYYVDFSRKMKAHKVARHDMAKMKFLEPESYYHYCAGDAVSHRAACLRMMELFPERTKDYYYEVYLPITSYFTDMEEYGIPIDKELLSSITDKYAMKYQELKTELARMLKDKFGVEDFNPNSHLQKKDLLFKTLKLPPAYYMKAGSKSPKPADWYNKQKANIQAQCTPSSNGKSLATMKFQLAEALEEDPDDGDIRDKLDLISLLLNFNRVGVFATKFLSKKGIAEDVDLAEEEMEDGEAEAEALEAPLKQSYWAAICKDGRIHASFFELLKNFRTSSSPNVQNPASKVLAYIPEIFVPGISKMVGDELKQAEKSLPNNIRQIFYAGENKDLCWVELDIAGADIAIAAYLSKDQRYIQHVRAGNFHQTKMREYFDDTTLTKKDTAKYVIAKGITFRIAYTSSLSSAAEPIKADIYAENGLLVDIETIRYALNTWLRYERYMEYREECIREVQIGNRITNARGMVLSYEESDNNVIKAGWQNEALAFPIASELALFFYAAKINIMNHFKKEGLWMKHIFPVSTVHDAGYWVAHRDLLKDNYLPEVLKYYMCDYTKLVTGDNVGIEMVVADRWKGKQKYFDNETVWKEGTQSWEWKS